MSDAGLRGGMERRAFLAIAGAVLLAGCRSDDGTEPTPTTGETTTAQPTATRSPTRSATATASPTETSTQTPTTTETSTATRTPHPESAEYLDEARVRLDRAVARYAAESHLFDPASILDTTADSVEFNPSRVNGSIEDARLSLDRAQRRATPAQRTEIEALRAFADWLAGAVAAQRLIVAAAADCRSALGGSAPHNERPVRDGFGRLSTSAADARRAVEALAVPESDVSDHFEALGSGDVEAKTAQLRAESTALNRFRGFGASVVEGLDLLREARTENFATAVELARAAVEEFRTVESDAKALDVPEALAQERRDVAALAADWRDHAEDRVEHYEDELSD